MKCAWSGNITFYLETGQKRGMIAMLYIVPSRVRTDIIYLPKMNTYCFYPAIKTQVITWCNM